MITGEPEQIAANNKQIAACTDGTKNANFSSEMISTINFCTYNTFASIFLSKKKTPKIKNNI